MASASATVVNSYHRSVSDGSDLIGGKLLSDANWVCGHDGNDEFECRSWSQDLLQCIQNVRWCNVNVAPVVMIMSGGSGDVALNMMHTLW